MNHHEKSFGRNTSHVGSIIQSSNITIHEWKCKIIPHFQQQRNNTTILKTWEPIYVKCYNSTFVIIGCFHKVDKCSYSVKVGVCQILECQKQKHAGSFEAKIESFGKRGSTVTWKGQTFAYSHKGPRTSILDCFIARCVEPDVIIYVSIKSDNQHQPSDEKWLEVPFKPTDSHNPFPLEIRCFQCMHIMGQKSKFPNSSYSKSPNNLLAQDSDQFNQITGNHWKRKNFQNSAQNPPKNTLAYKFDEFKCEAIKILGNVKPDTLEDSAFRLVYLYYKDSDIKRTGLVSNLIYEIAVESEHTKVGGTSLMDYADMILYIKKTEYGVSRNIIQGIIENCRVSFEGRHQLIEHVDFENVYSSLAQQNTNGMEALRFAKLCGNIQLIAELFNRQLLRLETIYSCIWTLAKSQMKVDQCYLAKLMRSVGMNLEYLILYPRDGLYNNDSTFNKMTVESLNLIYSKLWSFVQDSKNMLSISLDFLDICEERELKWKTIPNLQKVELYKETRAKLQPQNQVDEWRIVSTSTSARKKAARRKCKSESDKQSQAQIELKHKRKVSFAYVENRKPELHADKQFNLLFEKINTENELDAPTITRDFSDNIIKRLEIISQKFMDERKWEAENIKWLHC